MFTGIVEAGEIVKVDDGVLWVRAPLLSECTIGASVAINGTCLTVTEREGDTCRFDAMPETLSLTSLGGLEVGERVNLERPLRAGDELGGHIVQGHVDGLGEVAEVQRDGDDVRVRITADEAVMRYVVHKGSITVDGCSLTVSAVGDGHFEVSLIPHTLEVTTFKNAAAGRKVNLEVDVVAKYVEKFTKREG